MIDPHIIIQGDPKAGVPYVGLAKKFARQTHKAKIANKTWRVAADVVIRVENFFSGVGGFSKVWISGYSTEHNYEAGWCHLPIPVANLDIDQPEGLLFPTNEPTFKLDFMKIRIPNPGDPCYAMGERKVSWFDDNGKLTPEAKAEIAAKPYSLLYVERNKYLERLKATGQLVEGAIVVYKNIPYTVVQLGVNTTVIGQLDISLGAILIVETVDLGVEHYLETLIDKAYEVRFYLTGSGIYQIARTFAYQKTGKLKLLVQGALGAYRNTSYVLGLFGYLDTTDFTQGLYTTNDFEYYIISIGAVRDSWDFNLQISYRKCIFLGGAKAAQDYLRKNGETLSSLRLRQVEAYIFSYFYDLTDPIYIPVDESFTLCGTSVHYGWKFTWSGHKADIVTHTPIYKSGLVDDVIVLGQTARHYSVVFTHGLLDTNSPESSENPFFHFLIDVPETANWVPSTHNLMWSPSTVVNRSLPFVPHTKEDYPTVTESDVCVYCFYDHSGASVEFDSQLRMVRHMQPDNPTWNYRQYAEAQPFTQLLIGGKTTTLTKVSYANEHPNTVLGRVGGFYVEGEMSTDHLYSIDFGLEESGSTATNGVAGGGASENYSEYWGRLLWSVTAGTISRRTEFSGRYNVGGTTLIIPHQSSEAVYILSLKAAYRYTYLYESSRSVIVLGEAYGVPAPTTFDSTLTGPWAGFGISSGMMSASGGGSWEGWFDIKARLYYNSGFKEINVPEDSFIQHSFHPFDVYWKKRWGPWFDSNPFDYTGTSKMMYVRQSAGGAIFYSTDSDGVDFASEGIDFGSYSNNPAIARSTLGYFIGWV